MKEFLSGYEHIQLMATDESASNGDEFWSDAPMVVGECSWSKLWREEHDGACDRRWRRSAPTAWIAAANQNDDRESYCSRDDGRAFSLSETPGREY